MDVCDVSRYEITCRDLILKPKLPEKKDTNKLMTHFRGGLTENRFQTILMFSFIISLFFVLIRQRKIFDDLNN